MKVGVKVLPRKEVLDTQGRAVEMTLKQNGLQVTDCTVGRYIVVDVPATTRDAALAQARSMADLVLYNPLIENFELEFLG